jgi:ubiquinone/menaquinone biosynthesis C-methylase UbiE
LISSNAGFELFDDQAASFDQRAGLPVENCRSIAKVVVEAGKLAPGDVILEVGPGTGQIGRWFIAPLRYVGIDKSIQMLKQFQAVEGSSPGDRILVRADANQSWPLASGVARVVFSSRAMHLLDQDHAASEIFRVASHGGATLFIGRVERARESVRARMAREMNNGLRRHGYEGHQGEQRMQQLFESCRQRGAQVLEPLTVTTWPVFASPRQSLDSWRCLSGLGGVRVPSETKGQILVELEAWAEAVFGGLDERFESEESYKLRPVRIPPLQVVR